jgi:hypothetical protein
VKPAALIAGVLSAAALAAGDGVPQAAAPTPDMRSQMLSEFTFVPHPLVPAQPAPFLVAGSAPNPSPSASVPSDVVTMAPFTVLDTGRANELTASLAKEKTAAHTAMMMDKLGVGMHVVPVGKVLYLYAGTIFYIPFTAGFGISW